MLMGKALTSPESPACAWQSRGEGGTHCFRARDAQLGDRLPDALLLWGWASRCPCHRFEPTRDREREVEAAGETSGGPAPLHTVCGQRDYPHGWGRQGPQGDVKPRKGSGGACGLGAQAPKLPRSRHTAPSLSCAPGPRPGARNHLSWVF